MIRVVLTRKNGCLKKVSVSGHAESADYGKDLVCAAVSAICVGTASALSELCPGACRFVSMNNPFVIDVTDSADTAQTILESMIIQLKTVAHSNPGCLSFIIKKEV